MTRFRTGLKIAAVVLVSWVANVVQVSAQRVTTIASFDGTDGANPDYMSLVQGLDGNFYGTTAFGGNGNGTVFKVTPDGTLTTLYSFCAVMGCPDGSFPGPGLVLATDGNFYGTTTADGSGPNCSANQPCGTVFRITPGGSLTTIHNFCGMTICSDGGGPSVLIQASDGNLYGTTVSGGGYTSFDGIGTVFRMTLAGRSTMVYSFCLQSSCPDGNRPSAGVIQASDGSLYGTTTGGGRGYGTVFRILRGELTTLHNFENSDGADPTYASLVQGTDGNLYGTTPQGGSFGCGIGCGSVYGFTPRGEFGAEIFEGSNGGVSYSGLVQGTDGNFYGTTSEGGLGVCGLYGCGTIFRLGPGPLLTTLYNFCLQSPCSDGATPRGGLVQGTDGSFYGTTWSGGSSGTSGTVFKLDLGLAPFIKTVPTSGKPGTSLFILGNNLTGATSVTFNGTGASFTVVSATEITATVPAGATSGTVQVTTPSGTLNSNVAFRVNP